MSRSERHVYCQQKSATYSSSFVNRRYPTVSTCVQQR
ncbi:unnamed protein product [Haemonchus placei]|uniref:Uncharacterized protein n=1 Tax=Haemonchus placei TaxID=6290 RepID=A0A0N4W5L8_HAEPC|nr:unnamed protein product [Haemonchus placei]